MQCLEHVRGKLDIGLALHRQSVIGIILSNTQVTTSNCIFMAIFRFTILLFITDPHCSDKTEHDCMLSDFFTEFYSISLHLYIIGLKLWCASATALINVVLSSDILNSWSETL